MLHRLTLTLIAAAVILGSCVSIASGQDYWYRRAHSQGNLQLTIGPGEFGSVGWSDKKWLPYYDAITGDSVYGCVYPRESGAMYMQGQMVLGAISGRDTIANWYALSGEPWQIGSSNPGLTYYSPTAHSDLDIEYRLADTIAYDTIYWTNWERGPYVPLEIVGTQRSMAWAGSTVDDFVLFDYEFTNVGKEVLRDMWIGYWCDSYSYTVRTPPDDDDDLTGFLPYYAWPNECDFRQPLNIAYCMDNDGDPVEGSYRWNSRRGAVGLTLLGSSADSLEYGYNWYVWVASDAIDWGPRPQSTPDEPFRSFNPYFAYPGSDRNLYYILSHPHIAYDQMSAAVDHFGWMPPWGFAPDIAAGWPFDMFYYFGPFQAGVHEKIRFTMAVIGGDNVHTNSYAYFDPTDPQSYYDQLDFSELAGNAQWAQWVYDNPGVDTDSDGYFGEYRICDGETTWYKGDGVPDFRGNSPPPIPFTRHDTEPGKIIVRWNGFLSETTKDIFSGLVDFEGYRVYCGLDDRKTSLSLLTSYDKQNWFRWKFNALGSGEGRWINSDPPFSLDSLRILHNNPDLNPDDYPRQRPLFQGDSVFYFSAVDGNVYSLTSPNGIHKAYPEAVNPGTDSTLWTENDITTEHDGRQLPKYYEYEYIIDNLLPTVPYFVAVTVFDFGYSGGRGSMPPDETNPLNNVTECYAQTSSEIVEEDNLDAYVYPNPYRVDANYEDGGYENRKGNIIPDRSRLIHFGNLPRVCKIKVYSLDGDHIGTIDHNFPEGGPESMHDWWNLVSRSGLAVESGLYYWVVESETRTQIGKLVILK